MTDIERAIGHLERIANGLDRAAQECHGLGQVIHAVNSQAPTPEQYRDYKFQSDRVAEQCARLSTFAILAKLR